MIESTPKCEQCRVKGKQTSYDCIVLMNALNANNFNFIHGS